MFKLIIALLLVTVPAFAMSSYNYKINNASSMGASLNSIGVHVSAVDLVSIQAVWSGGGSPNGTFKIQVSNDDVAEGSAANPSVNVVNWSDYTGSAVAISADGDLAYNIANFGYRWIRLVYTRTSGTATLNTNLVIKSENRL